MVLLNLFGLVNIMLGVIGHEGTTVLVALNGLRALLLK
jgi:Cd2+/Zn2+-exporting ATPase